jgi:hypothetical protein
MARVAAAVLCGLFSAALGLAWEGVGLFTVAFAVTLTWLAMSDRLTDEMLGLHLIWCILAIPPLLTLTRAYHDVCQPHVGLALLPVPIVCLGVLLALTIRYLAQRCPVISALGPVPSALLVALSVAAVLLGGLSAAAAISSSAKDAVPTFLQNAMSTFGGSSLMRAIQELQDMFLRNWWGTLGSSLILFLLGSAVMHGDLHDGGHRRCWSLGVLTVTCSIAILGSNNRVVVHLSGVPHCDTVGYDRL